MTDVTSSAATIGALARYLAQWLRGLRSASAKRQADCIGAINAVIAGARRTQAYARQRDASRTDAKTEADLAAMWTDLGHQLEALGVKKLAKRCDVNGRYWAAPERFSKEWLADADVGLEAVERLARRLKAHIQAHGAP
jgi:hypothetical protein